MTRNDRKRANQSAREKIDNLKCENDILRATNARLRIQLAGIRSSHKFLIAKGFAAGVASATAVAAITIVLSTILQN